MPIKNVREQYTQIIDDYHLIVYPFIEGESGFSREISR